MTVDRKIIADGLRDLGLKTGDIVLLHSSLLSLGHVEGGPAAVIDAFLEVVGPEGTLLVPVFGALGILTEELKHRPGVVVSPSPVGTLAALGKDAEELCRDHWKAETAHGEDTPFTRLAAKGGYVCLMGVDQDRNTTLHSIEALLRLPYLRDTTATFTTPEGETVTKTWKYYPGPHRNFIGLDPLLAAATKRGRIGNSEVRLISAPKMFELALAAGRRDPAFVLCDNPACADCVGQRAAILRDRFDRESFQLAASARLAGRYVPEMIENLCKAGIRRVELDFIQGKAWRSWPKEKLAAWVAEFAENGIAVTGARCFGVPEEVVDMVELARAAGIPRIILPLNDSRMAGAAAAAAGLEVSWFNTNQSGIHAAAKFLRLRETLGGKSAGATFNPANFAAASEMPFLRSYRRGRFIKIIGQLDVNDCTWDGEPRRLAQGNGEIKELISILRCHNFAGFMTLGGGAVYPGTLGDAVADFTRLLNEM